MKLVMLWALFVFNLVCQIIAEDKLDQILRIVQQQKSELERVHNGFLGSFAYIRQRLNNLTGLDENISSIDNRMSSMEGKNRIFSSIDNRMSSMEEKMISLQDLITGASTKEQVSHMQQSLLEEQKIQMEIMNETCSRTQTLQDLIATESDVDDCSTATNNCSSSASCSKSDGSIVCSCLPGFTGDGVTCDDIDECSEETNTCDVNEDCINTEGSFRCNRIYFPLPCESPAQFVESVGCLIPVTERLSWHAAQENCWDKYNGRLVEGFEYVELHDIKNQFLVFFRSLGSWPWIGIRMKWSEPDGGEGGYPIPPDSPLWGNGEPDGGNEECVRAFLLWKGVKLYDAVCSYGYPSLCQI